MNEYWPRILISKEEAKKMFSERSECHIKSLIDMLEVELDNMPLAKYLENLSKDAAIPENSCNLDNPSDSEPTCAVDYLNKIPEE